MIGETVNIQGNSVPYAQLIIFRKHTPYYKNETAKDGKKTKKYNRTEEIVKRHLDKYSKLEEDTNIRPFAICLFGVDIKDENRQLIKDDFSENCQNPVCEKVDLVSIIDTATSLSVENFINKITQKAKDIKPDDNLIRHETGI